MNPAITPDLTPTLPPVLTVVKKRRDFLAAAASGKKCGTKGLVLQMRCCATTATPAPTGQRFGLTASKRVGNAVLRNRAKRRLRALAHAILPFEAQDGCDYILIAKTETITRPYADLRGDLRYALRKLGALRPV
jgi:ribonuclease P protein component